MPPLERMDIVVVATAPHIVSTTTNVVLNTDIHSDNNNSDNNNNNENNIIMDDQSVGSLATELSVEDLQNDKLLQQQQQQGWDPNASDYTLRQASTQNNNNDNDEQQQETTKENILGADYSLTVRLPQVNKNKTTDNDKQQQDTNEAPTTITETPEASPKKTKSSRKATFFPRVKVHYVRHINQMPMDEIESVWYTRKEVKGFRKECFKTIKMMVALEKQQDEEQQRQQQQEENNQDVSMMTTNNDENNENNQEQIIDNVNYCARGLEYKTPTKYRQRYLNKVELRQQVCLEQELQRDHEMPDADEYLAKISMEYSQSCVKSALELAAMDERVARQIHNEEEEEQQQQQ